MLLLLIRHGLTPQVGVKLTGWTRGVGLSDAGRAQADAVVPRLEGLHIDAIYSSPLERAVETAQPLARARKLRVKQREGLGEVHYGALQGKTYKTLVKSKVWRHLRAWPSDVRFPNGETLRETQARAVSTIEELRDAHMGDVVAVFSHADFIRLAVAHYLGVHIDLYNRIAIDPGSISAVQFFPMGVQVRRLNETGMMADLSQPKQQKAKR